jgi:hypothetical protein
LEFETSFTADCPCLLLYERYNELSSNLMAYWL